MHGQLKVSVCVHAWEFEWREMFKVKKRHNVDCTGLKKKNLNWRLCDCWLETLPTEGQAWLWTELVRQRAEWAGGKNKTPFWKGIILLQVQILTERRHHSKNTRALASVHCTSLAHSLHYLTHGNPLINPPPTFFQLNEGSTGFTTQA